MISPTTVSLIMILIFVGMFIAVLYQTAKVVEFMQVSNESLREKVRELENLLGTTEFGKLDNRVSDEKEEE